MNKLVSKNPVQRFKEGRKIDFFQGGKPIKRFALASSDNKFIKEFDTEAEARAYRKAHNITGVIRDQKNASNGSVVKVSRVTGKDAKTTAYDRQEAEKYNHLSYKDAYSAAQKSGNKYFAYKGKVYKTDLKNGARENQGIFSSGLVPSDEQWAAEHPIVSGITNGVLDVATFGPKPKFTREFKSVPRYGYTGRKFVTIKEEVPMGIYEGDLNISTGTTLGRNPYVELGKQVGETTKTITKKKMTDPGTRYIKYVYDKPTGNYNFSLTEGMKDMFPWITAITNNNVMK